MTAWMDRAACRDADPAIFFAHDQPGRWQDTRAARQQEQALALCAECPVRVSCLHYAIEHGITHGIWGGLTERERARARRTRRRTA